MYDDLQKLVHHTDKLNSLIHEMVWDDTEVKDIHKSSLEPYERAALEMLVDLRTQYESQNAAQASIKAAISYMKQVQTVSIEVEKRYQRITDEIGSVKQVIQQAKQQEHAVRSLLLRIQQFIAGENQTESE